MKTLTKRGIEIGTKQAKTKYGTFIALALAAGTGVGYLTAVGINKLKGKKQKITETDAMAAEKELIAGIEAYDKEIESNPNANPLPDITREEAEAKIDEYVHEIADEMNNKEGKKDG